ncbi:MAG: hypothetical protein N2589_05980, partial [bacterium]|nr:hypothetical protein [bacterium]
SNLYLQNKIKEVMPEKVKLFIPEKNLCIDNGVMVAIMAYFLNKFKIEPERNRISVIPTA